MRRLILTLLFLATLVALATVGNRPIQSEPLPAADSASRPENAYAVALPNDASPLRLTLSPRLGEPGPARTGQSAARAQPDAPKAAWPLDPLRLALFALAGIAGMALMRLWPATAETRAAPERIEPSLPITDFDEAAQADIDRLHVELAAAQDDLKSARTAHAELLEQVSALDQTLAESQQQSVALEATVAEREHDLAGLRAQLEDITRHDEQATETVTDLSARLSALDDDGVEQRVITVQFEKALLAAQEQVRALEAGIDAEQARVAERDAHIAELSEQIDARSAALEHAQTSDQAHAHEADAKSAEAQALKDELDAAREQLTANAEQLDELEQMRERLAAWQSSMDTYRNDLRARDAQLEALRATLDERDLSISQLTETAGEADALRSKLSEQEAVARVLKDAADSMRLHKARADERALEAASLKSELDRERQHEARLRTQLSDLRRQHETSQTALGDANGELFDLRQAVDTEQQRVQALEQQLEDAHRDGADWQSAHAALGETFATLRDTMLNDLGEVTAASDAAHSALDAPVPPLPAPIDDADDADDGVDLKALLRALRDAHDASLDAGQKAVGERDEAVGYLSALESDAVRRADAGRALERDRDETAALCRQLEARSIALTQRIAEQDAALADAQAHATSLDRVASELDERRAQDERLTERVASLVEARNAKGQRAASLRSALDAAQAQAQRHRVTAVATRHERDHMARTANALHRRLKALGAELVTARNIAKQVHKARRAQAAAAQALKSSQDERARQNDQLTQLAQTLEQRELETAQLQQQIDEMTAVLDTQRDAAEFETDTLTEANMALQSAIGELRNETESDLQRLRKIVAHSEATTAALTGKLRAAQELAERRGAKIETLEARIAEQSRALDEAKRAEPPAARVVDSPVNVPVLTRRAATPPVLTRSVTPQGDDSDKD